MDDPWIVIHKLGDRYRFLVRSKPEWTKNPAKASLYTEKQARALAREVIFYKREAMPLAEYLMRLVE